MAVADTVATEATTESMNTRTSASTAADARASAAGSARTDGSGWYVLTAGPAPGSRRPPRLRRVVAQVALAAVVVLVLVAIVGSVISRRTAQSQSIHEVAQLTNVIAESVVTPALTDAMATSPAAADAGLDKLVRTRVLSSDLVRVKLWTPQGKIVYSDERRLEGDTFDLGDEERDALIDPQTRAEVSDLGKPENRYERGEGKLLEVYRPVWTPGGKALLFETYFKYTVVSERATQLWRGFAGITLSSVAAVVLLLFPLAWTLLRRARRAHQEREAVLQRSMDASLDERRRIAATLHDGVVQELAAASYAVAAAAEEASARGATDLAERLRDAGNTVRTGIGGMRSLLVDIYPPSLQTAGLGPALRDLAGGMSARDPHVVVDVDDDGAARLNAEQQQACFRVAQECVRNAVRHAEARTVTISLLGLRESIVLQIIDDGRGFDIEAQRPEGHFGLDLITDVARSIDADLAVRSPAGAGTCWRLSVPIR
jgi:two-component system, NarL family, sensor kinase